MLDITTAPPALHTITNLLQRHTPHITSKMAVSMDCETSGLGDSDTVHVVSIHDPRAGTGVSFTDKTNGQFFVEHALEACARQTSVITFNGTAFDFRMMCTNVFHAADKARAARLALDSIDIMLNFSCRHGYYTSLQSFTEGTLKTSKSSSGTEAIDDWANGDHAKVAAYCEHDAALTYRLYEEVMAYGRLTRTTKRGKSHVWVCDDLRPSYAVLTAHARSRPYDTSWMTDPPDLAAAADWAVDVLGPT